MSDHSAATSQPNSQVRSEPPTRPTTTWQANNLATALRIFAAFGMTLPVISGTVLGWWEQGQFDWTSAVFVIVGGFLSALSVNALWELIDYRRGLAIDHHTAKFLPGSGNGLMRNGPVTPEFMRNLGLILGGAGLICGLLLFLLAGWPMLLFTVLAYFIALFYAAPPLRYGYRGWGLGEAGIFASFGLLHVAGGYYAVTQQLSWTTLAAAVPLGLLALLIVYNYNILRYRRDWIIRKRTLVVSLGLARGIDVSVVIAIAAYAAFVLMASLGLLPLWTLLSLGGLPVMLGAYSNIWRSNRQADDLPNLYITTLNAVLITCVLFCLALGLDRLL